MANHHEFLVPLHSAAEHGDYGCSSPSTHKRIGKGLRKAPPSSGRVHSRTSPHVIMRPDSRTATVWLLPTASDLTPVRPFTRAGADRRVPAASGLVVCVAAPGDDRAGLCERSGMRRARGDRSNTAYAGQSCRHRSRRQIEVRRIPIPSPCRRRERRASIRGRRRWRRHCARPAQQSVGRG